MDFAGIEQYFKGMDWRKMVVDIALGIGFELLFGDNTKELEQELGLKCNQCDVEM